MAQLHKVVLSCIVAFLCCSETYAEKKSYSAAMTLYEAGMYVQAMDCLQCLDSYGNDPMTDGYFALCALKLHTDGYEGVISNYLSKYSSCALCDEIYRERGFDFFDAGEYENALFCFDKIRRTRIPKNQMAAFRFKRGYSYYITGNEALAVYEFNLLAKMPSSDYSAPAFFLSGYMKYRKGEFAQAMGFFENALKDERFATISDYYLVNCKYELADYDFVLSEGVKLYGQGNIPSDIRAHLARIISESYLLKGDKANARIFFDNSDDGSPKSREDNFYAGCLMFTTGEYKRSVEYFSAMADKTDSLGQIALYQSGLAEIKLNNKISALSAFKGASELNFDAKMTEDAAFNYAKLAFDLNGDTSAFAGYMKRYGDKVRGEGIFSYMALVALADRDFQTAIDYYDKIDELKGKEKMNYVHANYLRGVQLMEVGSYRNAMQCFKTVAWYTNSNERLNQMARFSLAEACYCDGQYSEAVRVFTSLFNISALFGLPQNSMLAYNVAYSYFKQENFQEAVKWFGFYLSQTDAIYRNDAALRKADCIFATKEYETAAMAFSELKDVETPEGLYPRYKAALAYNLLKEYSRAEEMLDPVMTADVSVPYYTECLFELGKTRLQMKNVAGAKTAFSTLVDKAPDGPLKARALLETGTILRNASDKKGALKCYRMVVEQMPHSGYEEDALLAIESTYQSMNQPKEYFKYLEKIGKSSIKTESEKRMMIFDAAVQIFYSGKYKKALLAFQDYVKTYAGTADVVDAEFYIAQCHDSLGDKVQASDGYEKVLASGSEKFRTTSLRRIATLNFDLQNYKRSAEAFAALLKSADSEEVRVEAKSGLMRSSSKAKDYQTALEAASAVMADSAVKEDLKREALYVKAGSLMALSRRDEAITAYKVLAQNPKSIEGSEAVYVLIQDALNRADFKTVEDKVFAFSSSGTSHNYWLAKAFIALGDAYAAQGMKTKAAATYQSIADGYPDKTDGILDEVQLNLSKLNGTE